jgi:hypothetical protein
MNYIGRKNLIYVGSIISVIGIGMQQASSEWKLFLGGRLVNAIGFAGIAVFSPVWFVLYLRISLIGRIGEVVRPELRGTFLCTLNGSILFGQFLGVLISRGTSEIVGKWSYESLIVLQYMFPLILLVFAPWFPESAYYCLRQGKTEKARESLIRAYGSGDQDLIDCEMKRIAENVRYSEEIATAAAVQGGPLIKQCFSATNRVHTIDICLIVATNPDSFVASCSAAIYWRRFCAWMYF